MPLFSFPFTIVNGDPLDATKVMADLEAIRSVVNGQIEDVNISPSAAIQGSKLSNVAGSRVPSDRIEDFAITSDKLARGVGVGAPGAAISRADHIVDSLIPATKLANSTLGTNKFYKVLKTVALSGTLAADTARSDFLIADLADNYTPMAVWCRCSDATAESNARRLVVRPVLDQSLNWNLVTLNATGSVATLTNITVYVLLVWNVSVV